MTQFSKHMTQHSKITQSQMWYKHKGLQLTSFNQQMTVINLLVACCDFHWFMVTFPAAQHHCHLTSTNLYCLVTKACRNEQLAQSCYVEVYQPKSNPQSLDHKCDARTISGTMVPPQHSIHATYMLLSLCNEWKITIRVDRPERLVFRPSYWELSLCCIGQQSQHLYTLHYEA